MTDTNAQQNYANVYDNRIGFGKTPALILIDFVEAYFDKSCDLYADVEDALGSAVRIRDKAREAGIPIIYTNVVYHKSAINGGRFTRKHSHYDSFLKVHQWANGPKDSTQVMMS